MPLVRLAAPQHDYEIPPETPFHKLLIHDAGMDGSDAAAAARRLSTGKYVDVSFDLGEDDAARAFVRDVKALGLEAKFFRDEPLSWAGSRPRPWFLKLSLAVLISTGILLGLLETRSNVTATTISGIIAGLLFVCWCVSAAFGDRRPRTQAEKDWDVTANFWLRVGSLAAFALIATIVSEPILGLVLLVLALGGIGCALLIRMINRN